MHIHVNHNYVVHFVHCIYINNHVKIAVSPAQRYIHGRTGLILFGGHSISLPDSFAYIVHIYNFVFVRDFIRVFFKDFQVGERAFFKKGPFREIVY
jgi:hypothetical protein